MNTAFNNFIAEKNPHERCLTIPGPNKNIWCRESHLHTLQHIVTTCRAQNQTQLLKGSQYVVADHYFDLPTLVYI